MKNYEPPTILTVPIIIPDLPTSEQGKMHVSLPENPIVNEDKMEELSIALRKGTRSCTRYPIANFVSYTNLCTPYITFVSNLVEEEIPIDGNGTEEE